VIAACQPVYFTPFSICSAIRPAKNCKIFADFKGAQSYPSRTKDVDDVDYLYPAAVGLGVAQTLFSSLVQDYVTSAWLDDRTGPEGRYDLAGRATPRWTRVISSRRCWRAGITRLAQTPGGSSITTARAWMPLGARRPGGRIFDTHPCSAISSWDRGDRESTEGLMQAAFAVAPCGEALRRWIDILPEPVMYCGAVFSRAGAAFRITAARRDRRPGARCPCADRHAAADDDIA